MVSVTSALRFVTSTSCYHPRYQSRSSMYIRGLIARNFAELTEAVPIDLTLEENRLYSVDIIFLSFGIMGFIAEL